MTPPTLTGPQRAALAVLTADEDAAVTDDTDPDERTVNWRSALELLKAGYARQVEPHVVHITEDGHTAARRLGLE